MKSKRAQSVDDDETWLEGGVCPTLNAFDSGDTRATVAVIGFNWQNGGGYGNANPGLGITEDGTGPLSTSQVPAVSVVGVMGSISHTLTHEGADASEDGTGRGTPVVTASTVRRLTPIECERLQGFPDDHTAGQADSHRYKQCGNAVSVPVANYVACLVNMAVRSDDGSGTV